VPDDASRTQEHVQRWGSWIFLAVRLVHVAQAFLCVVSGRRSYKRPVLAGGTFAMCATATGWLIGRCVRTGIDPLAARVEVGVGTVGLLALAAATQPADRTTSLNWMLPYSVGGAVGIAMAVDPVPEGIASVAAMAGTYLATTTLGTSKSLHSSNSVTAIANAMSYVGFYAVAVSILTVVRGTNRALDEARALAQERGEGLAIEHERNRQHRLLHDSALQTLEAVASGLHSDPERVQHQARIEAARLRAALAASQSDAPAGASAGVEETSRHLQHGLEDLRSEYSNLGLECELTLLEVPQISGDRAAALLEATREALRNVLKHAGVRTAVVSCSTHDNGVKVTVRDRGTGFHPDSLASGFGVRQSICGRLDDVGGHVDVWSEPGRGTRITMWVPQ
jgi:signal transduction histidine kinase